jgi:hypothetical protein
MISRFLQDAQVEDIRKWITYVDLSTVNVLEIEQQLYQVLAKSQGHQIWRPQPIAPLSEPSNLQELVGDHLNGAQQEIFYQTQRTDNIYRWVNETNNSLTIQLESAEKLTTEASNAIQDIVVVASQDHQFFYWISETFNNTQFIDPLNTQALLDTDHGLVALSPEKVENVQDVTLEILHDETKGIPGCNLLIIDRGNAGGPEKEPEPILERSSNTDFGNVLDADPNTWFEIERNFIPPKQKLSRFGRAFVQNTAGQEMDVVQVTADLDWRAYVQWWDTQNVDSGADGKGVQLAEFKSIEDSTITQNNLSYTQTGGYDNRSCLAFSIKYNNPQPLSYVSIVPYMRSGQKLKVDSITAYAQDLAINIAQNVEASPTSNTLTLLNQDILRRTGAQTVGGLYAIPTNRDITKIEVRLSGDPYKAPYGLGHPFQEQLEATRHEQRVVFFSIVSHEETWSRIALNQTPRQIIADFSAPKLFGSLPQDLFSLLGLGDNLFGQLRTIQNTTQQVGGGIADLLNSIGQTKAATDVLKGAGKAGGALGGLLGGLGGFLGKALPVVGGILAIGDVVSTLFGSHTDSAVIETRKGTDIFDGWRSSVGLRSLATLRIKFASVSQVQSVQRQFQGPVKKIGLFAEELIPVGWGPGDWISYFISVDGQNWTQVSKTTDATLDGGIVLEQPTDLIYFKIILRGNSSDPFTSPQCKHIALQGLPA